MKKLLLAGLLGLAACSAAPEEKTSTASAEARNRLTVPTGASDQVSPQSTSRTDMVDYFFFTNASYRRLAVRNQLDMFKLDSLGALDVVGRDVEKLHYKIGETTTDFLDRNLPVTDSLPFEKVRLVSWSSDLSGNDEKLFYFENGRLRQVRKNR